MGGARLARAAECSQPSTILCSRGHKLCIPYTTLLLANFYVMVPRHQLDLTRSALPSFGKTDRTNWGIARISGFIAFLYAILYTRWRDLLHRYLFLPSFRLYGAAVNAVIMEDPSNIRQDFGIRAIPMAHDMRTAYHHAIYELPRV